MSSPKTQRKERETRLREVEQKTRRDLADLVPEIEALPPEAVDEDLLQAFDSAVQSADNRVKKARNGEEHQKG